MRLWIKLMFVMAGGVMLAIGAQARQRQAAGARVDRLETERLALFTALCDREDLSPDQRREMLLRMVDLCEEQARLNGTTCAISRASLPGVRL